MVTDHQHVEVLCHRVNSVGHRWVCGGRENVCFPTQLHNVWSVSSSSTLCVIGVDCAILESSDGILDKTTFIESVSMNCNLHIVFFSDTQTLVNCCWGSPPILV